MACPYCDSGNWKQQYGAFKTEEESRGIWAYYLCECYDCGETFVTKQWYEEDEDTYECMIMEEWHGSE